MQLLRIFRSRAHNYFGHYGKPAGTNPVEELAEAELSPGGGVPGDRFKQQVTFFSEEIWLRLLAEIAPPGAERGPDVFRRNLLVRGADLNALVGREFDVQGLCFRGIEYCKPCFWMDQAFAPGTLDALNRWQAGGLRAEVVRGGTLRTAHQPAEARS